MKIRESRADNLYLAVIYSILLLVLVVVAYPLLHIVAASFSAAGAVLAGRVTIIPVEPTLIAYEAVFRHAQVMRGFANSVFYTSAGTLLQVTMTVLIAYPLSRRRFRGRGVIAGLLIFTTFFSGGLIPSYLVVKSLGMINTVWAMIVPSAMAVFQVIICRTFFQMTIPEELLESAQIDGAGDIRFMLSVVIPLSRPIIAVLVLMYAVANWNSYFSALIYLNNERLYPLQLVLRNILILNHKPMFSYSKFAQMKDLADLLKYSLIVISSVPVLVLLPFIQKHFVKGMMIGSLKG